MLDGRKRVNFEVHVPLSCRSLWVSDLHLGTGAAKAAELLDFLAAVRPDRIYLVGDIVDLERIRSRPMFPESHRQVVRYLLDLAGSGTDIVYIPGNHDHEFRALFGRQICGIPVLPEATHVTGRGERLLVTHGDILDGRIRQGTNLEQFGAAAYSVLIDLDASINAVGRLLGLGHVPVSTWIKQRLGAAHDYMQRFERTAVEYASERGFDGIVCGHIHRPTLARVAGCLYANDGDWVEHRTALAELADGRLQLLQWQSRVVSIDCLPFTRALAA